jgi:hypothetical protein
MATTLWSTYTTPPWSTPTTRDKQRTLAPDFSEATLQEHECQGSLFCNKLATKRIKVSPTEYRFVCEDHILVYGQPEIVEDLGGDMRIPQLQKSS